jgi:hypothetical protein
MALNSPYLGGFYAGEAGYGFTALIPSTPVPPPPIPPCPPISVITMGDYNILSDEIFVN